MLVGRGIGGRGRGNGRGETTVLQRQPSSQSASISSQGTGKPAEHQESNEWTTVGKNNKVAKSFGNEKSTRYKFRLQMHMNLPSYENQTNFVNVPHHQKIFCTELFKIDSTINILKWEDEENKNTSKTNPITTIEQLPTDKKALSDWIAGTTASTDRNNKQTLKFFMYIETSINYADLRKNLKPWLEAHKHRIFATKLSTTNNRLLAWVKDSHPDWTRLDDLQVKLQELIIRNSEEYVSCELDLRPRRTRIGNGPNAIFIWAIGITCSLRNVQGYMKAILQGLSTPESVPDSLKHIQIIPFNPIPGIVSNTELIKLARDHDNLMTQLRKKSVIGFADITTPQPIKDMEELAETRATYTFQEYLLSQKNPSKTPLFQSVESRGKNGYLVIYREHLNNDVEDFFTHIQEHMTTTFQQEFIDNYLNAIQTHLDSIDVYDDNSAISTFSAADSYYKSIKSSGVSFTPETKGTHTTASSTQSGYYTPRKRPPTITLGYGDDVSSLGSSSAPAKNAWSSPPKITNHQTTTTVSDDNSVATLKSEVQGWFEELKQDSKTEWENSLQKFNSLNDKLTEVTASNEKLQQTLEVIQENHKQALEEQRSLFEDLIKNNLKDLVNQTVSQQIHLQTITTPNSPLRKQHKVNPSNEEVDSESQQIRIGISDSPVEIQPPRSPRPTTGPVL